MTSIRKKVKTKLSTFWSFFVFVCVTHALGDVPTFEALSVGEVSSWDDYQEPFLIVRTAQKYKLTVEAAAKQVREKLKSKQLNVKTHFSKDGIPLENFKIEYYQLPKEISEEKQEEAIKDCNREKCLMKLKTNPEVIGLSKAKHKKEFYRQLLYQRIRSYVGARELLGYEDRKSNQPYISKMLKLIPTLNLSPISKEYLMGRFWKDLKGKGQPVDSWLRQEMVVIAPDQMQPILRVSEDFEFGEAGNVLFFELPIYTNHYFDSSVSLYEVVGNKKKPTESMVVFTDVMEIDELKKSGLIRTLFKGKMVKAISQYQEQLLESISRVKDK